MYISKPLPYQRPILSVYTGFFSGGARNVHTDIVGQMHEFGVPQVVVNIRDQVDRGLEGVQDKSEDANYRTLVSKGVYLRSIGLDATEDMFSQKSVRAMASELQTANPRVVLCLKEQSADLVVKANMLLERSGFPTYPIIIALHRTDPGIQDPESLEHLKALEQSPKTKKFILGYLACAESAALAYCRALDLEHEYQRFKYVPNGIDLDMFKPATQENKAQFFKKYMPDAFDRIVDSPIVIIGARNSKEKNIDLFIQSAVRFLTRNHAAHAVMCGTGMTKSKLGAPIKNALQSFDEETRTNIQGRIHPIGPIPREDMATLASAAKVVALTSPTLGEADPLILKEGMSCGAVPVSTCTGDTPRVLGVSNHQALYLKEIDTRFIFGTRGIITSQNAPDIAKAWEHAIRYENWFSENINEFRPKIAKSVRAREFLEAVEDFCANRECQNRPEPLQELYR